MIYMIIFALLVLLLILSISLIRYHLALKNLSQQIEDKILTGSMKRDRSSAFFPNIFYISTSRLRIYFRKWNNLGWL